MQRWLPPFEWLPPRRLTLLADPKETPVPDPTPPTPAPAHPWKKTARTALAGVITAAVIVPLAVEAAGIDVTAQGWRWLGGTLAVLAAVTRILAVPQVNVLLGRLGLGHDDVESDQVLALVVPESDAPARIVAGEKALQPTGSPLPATTTVEQLVGPPPGA